MSCVATTSEVMTLCWDRNVCCIVLLRWQEFATRSVAVFFTCHRGAGGKYRSVSWLGLLIGNRLVVLECANCWLHAAVEGALSETVAMVSLSTVPRLSPLPAAVRFVSGEADVRGRAGGIAADWSRRAFTFTQGSNNAAKVRGSFQETAPRKTAEHTVKHVRWS